MILGIDKYYEILPTDELKTVLSNMDRTDVDNVFTDEREFIRKLIKVREETPLI